jgi:WD40 repeat protein
MVKRSKINNKLKGGKPFVGKFCREISTLPGQTGAVTFVTFHPSHNLLATCSTDSTAKLWQFDPDGSNPVCTGTANVNGHFRRDMVNSLAFHPSRNLLAIADSFDKTAKLWRFNDNGTNLVCADTANVNGHMKSVSSLAFHPSLNLLATGSSDNTAQLWSFNDNGTNLVFISTLNGHREYITSVAFHPDGNFLATGSGDNTANLWSFRQDGSNPVCTGTANVNGHTHIVNSIAFHPRGNLLATGSADYTAKLWSFNDDGKNLVCISTLKGHTGWVNSVAFHPNGEFLATGSWDKTSKLWSFRSDGSNPRCIETLTGNTGLVNSVAFNRNGNLLATGDNTAKLWNFSKLSTEYRRQLALSHGKLATSLIAKLTENPQLNGTWSKYRMISKLNQNIGNVLEINTQASKANPDRMKAQKYLEFLPREPLQQPDTSLRLAHSPVEDTPLLPVVKAPGVTTFCAVDDTSCISIYHSIPWSQLNSIPGGCDEASDLLEKLIRLESLLKSSSSPEIDSKLRLTTLWIKKLRNKIDQCRP